MIALLDTNVLIDYFDQREPFFKDSVRLKAMSLFGDIDLWATSNCFTDLFYVLNKSADSAVIQQAIQASKGYLNICSVDADDIYRATAEQWRDFEDCLLYVCALKIKADYIITRDLNGFKQSKIPCLAPSEFLEQVSQATGVDYGFLDALKL